MVLSTQNLIFSLHNSLEGPFTLLAPTDEAFSRIPRETLKKVLENADILKPIIQRHIIPKKALHVKGISWDVHDTLGGQMVSFKQNKLILNLKANKMFLLLAISSTIFDFEFSIVTIWSGKIVEHLGHQKISSDHRAIWSTKLEKDIEQN